MATLRPFRMQLAESPVSFFVLRGNGLAKKSQIISYFSFSNPKFMAPQFV
jgi:hypothetical protein